MSLNSDVQILCTEVPILMSLDDIYRMRIYLNSTTNKVLHVPSGTIIDVIRTKKASIDLVESQNKLNVHGDRSAKASPPVEAPVIREGTQFPHDLLYELDERLEGSLIFILYLTRSFEESVQRKLRVFLPPRGEVLARGEIAHHHLVRLISMTRKLVVERLRPTWRDPCRSTNKLE